MTLTQGRGLGLATPLITANSVSFFLTKSAFIQLQNVFTSTLNRRCLKRALHFSTFTSAPSVSQMSAALTVLAARAFQYMHKGAGMHIACIISYQIAKETTRMQCRDQLSQSYQKGD